MPPDPHHPWKQVRLELGGAPIAQGHLCHGAIYFERYFMQMRHRKMSAAPVAALLVHLGGHRVRGGTVQQRHDYLPTQVLLLPALTDTDWQFSGTVDFALFYILHPAQGWAAKLMQQRPIDAGPLRFVDPLVSALAQQIVHTAQGDAQANQAYLDRLTELLLEQAGRALQLSAAPTIEARPAQQSRLQAVLNHIHQHPDADLTGQAMAEQAGISPTHLRRVFEKAVGQPLHRYVLHTRLKEASRLLARTNLPIAQIAQACGFSSQSHLTSSFRQQHAATPAQYRAAARQR